jgi:hypothetical protein
MQRRHLLRLGAALATTVVLGSTLSAPAQASSDSGKVGGTIHASGLSSLPGGGFVVAIWPAKNAPLTFRDEPPKYKVVPADGHYKFTGLKPGKYVVGATDFSQELVYEYGFYKSQPLSSNARHITVTNNHTVTGINISLHHAAIIGATVKNTAGTGMNGMNVAVYDADGQVAGFNDHNESDGSGAVDLRGLPAGSYRFKLSGPGIPDQWANGIDRFSAAKATKVTRGQHLTGVVLTARANPAIAHTAKPTITGTLKKGHTLTSSDAAWATAPTSYVYRWLRDGKPISGATAKTYKLTSSDVGKHISVRVGAVAPDTVTGTTTSLHTSRIK